jgi:protein gp37
MSENSKIEWTDHTFNPWIGCTKVSPGCANCYAETLMDTRYGRVKWGKGNARVRTSESNWRGPLIWNRKATSFRECTRCHHRSHMADGCTFCGCDIIPARPRVFCASLADWLDDEVPIEWLADLLSLIHDTPHIDWLLLTKRPENWLGRLSAAFDYVTLKCRKGWLESWLACAVTGTMAGDPPSNVWIGSTTEDHMRADERIPALLKIPARVRFLSCEPLLGPVDVARWLEPDPCVDYYDPPLSECVHWVICGGESGPGARPMHPDWARSLRDQCAAAGVAFHFKQWGEHLPSGQDDATGKNQCTDADFLRVGKKRSGRMLDGREWNEFPATAVAARV